MFANTCFFIFVKVKKKYLWQIKIISFQLIIFFRLVSKILLLYLKSLFDKLVLTLKRTNANNILVPNISVLTAHLNKNLSIITFLI